MVAIKPVLEALLKASLRRFITTSSRSKEAGSVILVFVAALQLPKVQAKAEEFGWLYSLGEDIQAQAFLHGIFIVWLLAPLLLRSGGLNLDSIVRLRRHPFTPWQVFFVGFCDLLVTPFFWLLVVCSFMAWPIVEQAPLGIAAIPGFILFFLACLGSLFTLSHLALLSGISRKARIVCFVLGLFFLLIAEQYPEVLYRTLPSRAFIRFGLGLNPATDTALLLATSLFWVISALLSFLLLLGQIRNDTGDAPLPQRAWSIKLPMLPGIYGRLLRWNILNRIRYKEVYLGLVVTLGASVYYLFSPEVSHQSYWVALGLIVAMAYGLFNNLFGPDGSGVIRYLLWPIPTRHLLLVCNGAVVIVLLLPLVPVLLLGAFRFGLMALVVGTLLAVGLMLYLAIWGNPQSISDPAKRTFFSNNRALFSVMMNLVTVCSGLLPGVVFCVLFWDRAPGLLMIVWLFIDIFLLFIFWQRLPRLARRFDTNGARFQSRMTSLED